MRSDELARLAERLSPSVGTTLAVTRRNALSAVTFGAREQAAWLLLRAREEERLAGEKVDKHGRASPSLIDGDRHAAHFERERDCLMGCLIAGCISPDAQRQAVLSAAEWLPLHQVRGEGMRVVKGEWG